MKTLARRASEGSSPNCGIAAQFNGELNDGKREETRRQTIPRWRVGLRLEASQGSSANCNFPAQFNVPVGSATLGPRV